MPIEGLTLNRSTDPVGRLLCVGGAVHYRLFSCAICVLLVSLSSYEACAANRTWTNAGGGNFGTNSNWSGGVPGINDKANFAAAGNYIVTFNTTGGLPNPVVNQDLFINGGNVTFTDLVGAPYSYRLSGTSGNVEMTGGTLSLGASSNPFNVTIDHDLVVDTSTLNISHGSEVTAEDLRLGQAGSGFGTINVDGNGSALNVTNNILQSLGLGGGDAQLTFRNNATGSFAGPIELATTNNAGTIGNLTIESGADLTTASLSIGTGTAAATGTVNINGAGSTLVQNGAATLTVGTTSAGATGIGAINIGTTTSGGSLTTGTGLLKINKFGTVSVGSASTTGTLNANGNVAVDGGILQILNLGSAFQLPGGATVNVTNGGQVKGVATTTMNSVYNVNNATWHSNLTAMTIDQGAQFNVNFGTLTDDFFKSRIGTAAGSGMLSVQDSGTANLTYADVGYNSTVNIGTDDLLAGNSTLSLRGLNVNATGIVNIGGTTSHGVLQAEGISVAGGVLQINPAGDIDLASSGEFYVVEGGRASFDLNGLTLDAAAKDLRNFIVDGAGSRWEFTNGSSLTLGTGEGLVDTGGTLHVDGNLNLVVAAHISSINGNISVGGTLSVLNASKIEMSQGTLTAGSIVGSGNSITFPQSTISITGPAGHTLGFGSPFFTNLSLSSGQALLVASTTTIPVGSNLTLNGGTFRTGALSRAGSFTFNSGILGITGPSGLTIGGGGIFGDRYTLNSPQTLQVTNTLTIAAGGQLIAISAGGLSAGSLLNNGDLVVIDSTVDGPVVNNSNVTVVGTANFNGLVSGPGHIYGPGTAHFNGGFSPGASPANISIEGSVAFDTANTLFIEIGGTQHDRLTINGSATLDGWLNLSLLNGFTPIAGQQFTIITASSIVNNGFVLTGAAASSFSLIVGSTSVILQAIGLTGDYNNNGVVDASDYVLWRNSAGLTGPGLAADGNHNNQIDSGDYDVWRSHFGQTSGSGASVGSNAAVPEPNSLSVALVAMMAFVGQRRAARRTARLLA